MLANIEIENEIKRCKRFSPNQQTERINSFHHTRLHFDFPYCCMELCNLHFPQPRHTDPNFRFGSANARMASSPAHHWLGNGRRPAAKAHNWPVFPSLMAVSRDSGPCISGCMRALGWVSAASRTDRPDLVSERFRPQARPMAVAGRYCHTNIRTCASF